MGYTTTTISIYSTDMPQTPQAIAKVTEFAGFDNDEAADAIGMDRTAFWMASELGGALPDDKWRRLLDVCGKRSFDHDGDLA